MSSRPGLYRETTPISTSAPFILHPDSPSPSPQPAPPLLPTSTPIPPLDPKQPPRQVIICCTCSHTRPTLHSPCPACIHLPLYCLRCKPYPLPPHWSAPAGYDPVGLALLEKKLAKEAQRQVEWEAYEAAMRRQGFDDPSETVAMRERRRRWFVERDEDGDVRMGGMDPFGGYGGYEAYVAQGGIGLIGSGGGYGVHGRLGYQNGFGLGEGYGRDHGAMHQGAGERGWGNFVRMCILVAVTAYFFYVMIFT
ncbi:MAG: hypothetical protein HETSPECPRED_004450 [Heterodermia speciosa]|uniref:Uncharacterized protein n=1 Tax=Heterodermia speciosa TaxID=116794 RepID=A0A8H3FB67_9LECA|nr:MAG: hypothetical protein HETSPECPRED_004450 [Heterodermia speciosa]